jgi:hypothetical protein
MAALPQVNIQTGAVTGTLTHGQQFEWYNPTNSLAFVTNCGNFCVVDSYEVPATGTTVATIVDVPNQEGLAFSSSAANVGGMPHVQGPINVGVHQPGGKKVA